MDTDLDRMLSASLQAQADAGSPIDPQPLLHTAVARGRQLRTRRRAATTALAAAVVVALTATTMLLPRHHPTASLTPDPSSSGKSAVNLARLPDATGQPGATLRPDLIGSDPQVLHFSVDALAAKALRVTWSSSPGVETANVQRDDFQVFVALGQTPQKLAPPVGQFSSGLGIVMSAPVAISVGGRAATLSTNLPPAQARGSISSAPLPTWLYSFEWQPVIGAWTRVEVQTSDQEKALHILRQIRFDQSRQCLLPVRPGLLPTGTVVPDCTVALAVDSLGGGLYSDGSMTVVDGRRRLLLQAMAAPPGGGEYPRPLKAGPYQVLADPDGRSWTMLIKGLFITASTETRKNPFTQAEVLQILGGLQIADQLNNPAAW